MTDPFTAWAATYPQAAAALRAVTLPPPPPPGQGSEQRVQSLVRLEAPAKGYKLFRNNVGAGEINGSFIRWGICNDTPAINKVLKSADLIGWRQEVITSGMVGSVIARFASVEVKAAKGRVHDAQTNWANLVRAGGGLALIVNQEGMLP